MWIKKSTNIWHPIRSGALAGIGSSIVFMIIHDIYISCIWFSWPIMILVTLLGLNVSIIGLVSIPGSSIHLIIEMFGFIMVLNVFYVIFYILLEKKSLLHMKKYPSPLEL